MEIPSPLTPLELRPVEDPGTGPPPPPSPLSGCYLLIVIGEPYSESHKEIILQRISKGFLSWDSGSSQVDLEKELQALTAQAPEGEEARNGERLIQYATENLVTEVLIHPQVNTLLQCVRNLLSSFTRHRHLVHAGYTFTGNGSWILQDGTFSLADFIDAFQEVEVQRVLRAYENSVTVDVHCSPEGDWTTERLSKESFSRSCKVRVNPDDRLTTGSAAIGEFIDYISPFLKPASIENLLEPSDVVGNIRFSHPTLYVFPGGQGDAALFGINGFNMLVDGGFGRKSCFWDFARHLDRLDAVLVTRLNNGNASGIASLMRRKKLNHVYPQIGHFFCNLQERRHAVSPDGDKDCDPLLVSLADEGQEIVLNLRHLQLRPHSCYREGNNAEPVNLYHKVGHGKLDMYIISPTKDSREVKDFLARWNTNDARLFTGPKKDSKEFYFPLQNLVSICALLVWQPANPSDTITRILFPGSTPQHKIFEGLEKLKHLEFLKHPVCSMKSITPSGSTVGISSKLGSKVRTTATVLDKLLPGEKEIMKEASQKAASMETNKQTKSATIPVVPDIKPIKVASLATTPTAKVLPLMKQKIDKPAAKPESLKKTEANKSLDGEKTSSKTEKTPKVMDKKIEHKPRTETKPTVAKSRPDTKTTRSAERKVQKATVTSVEKKPEKSSPTTPKKTVTGVASKVEIGKTSRSASKGRPSPTATPAKSAKDANNRKVVESKINVARVSSTTRAPTKTLKKEEVSKPERKPITRKPKASTPSVTKGPSSPAKSSTKSGVAKTEKESAIRKTKPSSAVDTNATLFKAQEMVQKSSVLLNEETVVEQNVAVEVHAEQEKENVHEDKVDELADGNNEIEVTVEAEHVDLDDAKHEDENMQVTEELEIQDDDHTDRNENENEIPIDKGESLQAEMNLGNKRGGEEADYDEGLEVDEGEVADDDEEYLVIDREEVEDSFQEQESLDSHIREVNDSKENDAEGDEEMKKQRDEVESEKEKREKVMDEVDIVQDEKDKTDDERDNAQNLLEEMENNVHDSSDALDVNDDEDELQQRTQTREMDTSEGIDKLDEDKPEEHRDETKEHDQEFETVIPSLDKDNLITPENKEQIEEEVQEIILSAQEIISKKQLEEGEAKTEEEKEEGSDKKKSEEGIETKELSSISPEEKFDNSSEKNRETTDDNRETTEDDRDTDQRILDQEHDEYEIKRAASREIAEQKYPAEESHPDERFSTTVESAATTAPTLPEDERIPLDEIKEIIEEKHVKEETKERDVSPVVVMPRHEQPTTLPKVVIPGGVATFPPHGLIHHRDIVKTPDEVADLPVHEEVDPGMYESDEFARDFHKVKDDSNSSKKQDMEELHRQSPEFGITGELQLKDDGKKDECEEDQQHPPESSGNIICEDQEARDIHIQEPNVEDAEIAKESGTIFEKNEERELFEKNFPHKDEEDLTHEEQMTKTKDVGLLLETVDSVKDVAASELGVEERQGEESGDTSGAVQNDVDDVDVNDKEDVASPQSREKIDISTEPNLSSNAERVGDVVKEEEIKQLTLNFIESETSAMSIENQPIDNKEPITEVDLPQMTEIDDFVSKQSTSSNIHEEPKPYTDEESGDFQPDIKDGLEMFGEYTKPSTVAEQLQGEPIGERVIKGNIEESYENIEDVGDENGEVMGEVETTTHDLPQEEKDDEGQNYQSLKEMESSEVARPDDIIHETLGEIQDIVHSEDIHAPITIPKEESIPPSSLAASYLDIIEQIQHSSSNLVENEVTPSSLLTNDASVMEESINTTSEAAGLTEVIASVDLSKSTSPDMEINSSLQKEEESVYDSNEDDVLREASTLKLETSGLKQNTGEKEMDISALDNEKDITKSDSPDHKKEDDTMSNKTYDDEVLIDSIPQSESLDIKTDVLEKDKDDDISETILPSKSLNQKSDIDGEKTQVIESVHDQVQPEIESVRSDQTPDSNENEEDDFTSNMMPMPSSSDRKTDTDNDTCEIGRDEDKNPSKATPNEESPDHVNYSKDNKEGAPVFDRDEDDIPSQNIPTCQSPNLRTAGDIGSDGDKSQSRTMPKEKSSDQVNELKENKDSTNTYAFEEDDSISQNITTTPTPDQKIDDVKETEDIQSDDGKSPSEIITKDKSLGQKTEVEDDTSRSTDVAGERDDAIPSQNILKSSSPDITKNDDDKNREDGDDDKVLLETIPVSASPTPNDNSAETTNEQSVFGNKEDTITSVNSLTYGSPDLKAVEQVVEKKINVSKLEYEEKEMHTKLPEKSPDTDIEIDVKENSAEDIPRENISPSTSPSYQLRDEKIEADISMENTPKSATPDITTDGHDQEEEENMHSSSQNTSLSPSPDTKEGLSDKKMEHTEFVNEKDNIPVQNGFKSASPELQIESNEEMKIEEASAKDEDKKLNARTTEEQLEDKVSSNSEVPECKEIGVEEKEEDTKEMSHVESKENVSDTETTEGEKLVITVSSESKEPECKEIDNEEKEEDTKEISDVESKKNVLEAETVDSALEYTSVLGKLDVSEHLELATVLPDSEPSSPKSYRNVQETDDEPTQGEVQTESDVQSADDSDVASKAGKDELNLKYEESNETKKEIIIGDSCETNGDKMKEIGQNLEESIKSAVDTVVSGISTIGNELLEKFESRDSNLKSQESTPASFETPQEKIQHFVKTDEEETSDVDKEEELDYFNASPKKLKEVVTNEASMLDDLLDVGKTAFATISDKLSGVAGKMIKDHSSDEDDEKEYGEVQKSVKDTGRDDISPIGEIKITEGFSGILSHTLDEKSLEEVKSYIDTVETHLDDSKSKLFNVKSTLDDEKSSLLKQPIISDLTRKESSGALAFQLDNGSFDDDEKANSSTADSDDGNIKTEATPKLVEFLVGNEKIVISEDEKKQIATPKVVLDIETEVEESTTSKEKLIEADVATSTYVEKPTPLADTYSITSTIATDDLQSTLKPASKDQDISQSASDNDESVVGDADNAGSTVQRMLVTASSEDGGTETEVCPTGSINFSTSLSTKPSSDDLTSMLPDKEPLDLYYEDRNEKTNEKEDEFSVKSETETTTERAAKIETKSEASHGMPSGTDAEWKCEVTKETEADGSIVTTHTVTLVETSDEDEKAALQSSTNSANHDAKESCKAKTTTTPTNIVIEDGEGLDVYETKDMKTYKTKKTSDKDERITTESTKTFVTSKVFVQETTYTDEAMSADKDFLESIGTLKSSTGDFDNEEDDNMKADWSIKTMEVSSLPGDEQEIVTKTTTADVLEDGTDETITRNDQDSKTDTDTVTVKSTIHYEVDSVSGKITSSDVMHTEKNGKRGSIEEITSDLKDVHDAGIKELKGEFADDVIVGEEKVHEVIIKSRDLKENVNIGEELKSILDTVDGMSSLMAGVKKEYGFRSGTPGSDDIDMCGPLSPMSDISSGQVSRVPDSRHCDSDVDDDAPGSPSSTTSQHAHSPSHFSYDIGASRTSPAVDIRHTSSTLQYDPKHVMELETMHKDLIPEMNPAMSSSLYGQLPPDPLHHLLEEREEQEADATSIIQSKSDPMTTSFYSTDSFSVDDTAKYAGGYSYETATEGMQRSKDFIDDNEEFDFEKAMHEHRTARGNDLASSPIKSYRYETKYSTNGKGSPSYMAKYEQYSDGENGKYQDELTDSFGHGNVDGCNTEEEMQITKGSQEKTNGKSEGHSTTADIPLPSVYQKDFSTTTSTKEFTIPSTETKTSSISSTSEKHEPTVDIAATASSTSSHISSTFSTSPKSDANLPEGTSDPIQSWGKPLGLPSPAPPPSNAPEIVTSANKGTPKKEKKPVITKKSMTDNKTGLKDAKKRPESPVKHADKKSVSNKDGGRGTKATGNPIYMDLTYVPHHGNSYYSNVEFFKKIRARYYVFSGTEPSREVYNALLEAKQSWDDKELEVTIIPTYDTDTLGYWVAENEDILAKHKIDLSPSASRCTINLQDHETSCSAYRLEF